MVKYLSGNIIEGSSTLTSAPPQTSWKELGRATAGSGGSTSLTTSAFTAKDNLMIIYNSFGSDPYMQVGTGGTIDTNQNYALRYSENGGADGTNQGNYSRWNVNGGAGATGTEGVFGVTEGVNINGQQKLFTLRSVDNASGTGAGTATGRYEREMKYTGTSQINIAKLFHTSGTLDEGSEIIVLGCDNDEPNSGTNFWQELANVKTTSTVNEINSGTFTAKKYLWIELNVIGDGSISGSDLHFNGDTNQSYSRRYSNDGGSDETGGVNETTLGGGTGGNYGRNHWFIINRANREKLAVGQAMWGSTGSANNPSARELSGKWNNTSDQITSIKVKENASGGWASGSVLKVWGSD